MTPIGKITVIKSLLVSKFTHLFLSIPTPAGILKNLNAELYPDKINRQDLCTQKLHGGLNMVNIFLFEKALRTELDSKNPFIYRYSLELSLG